jgi:hypothetical protein
MNLNQIIAGISEAVEIAQSTIQIRGGLFTDLEKKDKEQIVEYLVSIGAEVTEDRTVVSDSGLCELTLEGQKFAIWYSVKKTTEEQIAELESKIARLRGEE